MIIFKNGFICLLFEPATDILTFEMPNVDSIVMPEMKRSLDIIVEHTRNYDVQKILLDARKTNIWVEESEYAAIIATFYHDLAATRVKKVARLIDPESKRENIIGKVLKAAAVQMKIKGFTETAPAREWLIESRQFD